MDEISRQSGGAPGIDPRRLVARLIVAVLLAEGIWALLVAITNGLILPGLARVMGGDSQSPLYLGKGDFNPAAVFIAVIELCFAGIVAAGVNYWAQRPARAVRRMAAPMRITPQVPIRKTTPAQQTVPASAPPAVPPVATPIPPATLAPPKPSVAPPMPSVPTQPTVAPSTPSAPTAKPAIAQTKVTPAKKKPEKPKEVYYNIVGEPIYPTEDDE